MIVVEACLGVGRALDADQHAAGLGLVQDLRRHDLQHDREAHAGRELCAASAAVVATPFLAAPGCRKRRRRACPPGAVSDVRPSALTLSMSLRTAVLSCAISLIPRGYC